MDISPAGWTGRATRTIRASRTLSWPTPMWALVTSPPWRPGSRLRRGPACQDLGLSSHCLTQSQLLQDCFPPSNS